jgi:transcriptional antiterminator NusG
MRSARPRVSNLTAHSEVAIFMRISGVAPMRRAGCSIRLSVKMNSKDIPKDPGSILERPSDTILLTPQWYALYTRSRFEKKMLTALTDRNVEVFLPMREVLSRWKDRKKKIWLPLFPGYLFVNHVNTPENRFRILNLPGAVRFVGFEGRADPVPDDQVLAIRRFLESSLSIDPYPYIQVGTRVEVTTGPLKGVRGMLMEKRGKFRFVLQVDLIRQAVSVEIDASDVQPV